MTEGVIISWNPVGIPPRISAGGTSSFKMGYRKAQIGGNLISIFRPCLVPFSLVTMFLSVTFPYKQCSSQVEGQILMPKGAGCVNLSPRSSSSKKDAQVLVHSFDQEDCSSHF